MQCLSDCALLKPFFQLYWNPSFFINNNNIIRLNTYLCKYVSLGTWSSKIAVDVCGRAIVTSMNINFSSRRSPVLSCHGCVACTNPLAAEIGLTILKKGGNAADAAVGVAAGLNVTEPFSTGIGGDCFCLFYDAATKRVRGINGR